MAKTHNTDARCVSCKFFKRKMYPVKSWDERKADMLAEYPNMSHAEAATLASNHSLFAQMPSDKFGTCKYKELPYLRDVEMDGTNFGCIHFKK